MSTGEREETSASSPRDNEVNEQIRDKLELPEFLHLKKISKN